MHAIPYTIKCRQIFNAIDAANASIPPLVDAGD